jgi:hypothetical protein
MRDCGLPDRMDKRNSKPPKGERSGLVVASERKRGNKWKTTSIRS